MDCLFCKKPIEDGDDVIDGQHGKAVVRDEEWTGEVEFGSRFSSVHEKCFEKAKEQFHADSTKGDEGVKA